MRHACHPHNPTAPPRFMHTSAWPDRGDLLGNTPRASKRLDLQDTRPTPPSKAMDFEPISHGLYIRA